MPKPNSMISIDARVSVSKQFLTRTEVPALLKDKYDFSTPGLRLHGVVIGSITGTNGNVMWQIVFDDLPDRNFSFSKTTIKYEGPGRSTRPVSVPEPTNLDHSTDSSDNSNEEEEMIDNSTPAVDNDWKMDDITIDARNIGPSYRSLTSKFNLSNLLTASPDDFFLFFLPMDYIRDVVIPNTNAHASTVTPNWIDITFTEYLTWMALLMTMTVMVYADNKAYWHMGSSHFFPSINFSDYMEYERFFMILESHVFERYDTGRYNADPLYQIRGFLAAFNETLSKCLEPGRYLCVDESMNQWLCNGMPNLKKVPSTPQEFKTLVDNHTNCILQLDTVSDKVRKEFDDVDGNLIATVKRLCKPWFASGRTIIADSCFGSPLMTNSLLDQGLYSIMQVAKRTNWPRGMPGTDIIQCLQPERGSSASMSKTDDLGRTIFVCAFKDKKAKALISSCSTTMPSTRVYQEVNGKEIHLPQVFEEYESQKSNVDANNRSNNMISFYNIMKTYRWEVRFLSFVFGIAEANAFSCYKIWGNNTEEILHSDFKCMLAQFLLKKVKELRGIDTVSRSSTEDHRYVVLAQYPERKRLVCKTCKERGVKPPPRVSKRCSCNPDAMCQKCHQLHFAQELNNNNCMNQL